VNLTTYIFGIASAALGLIVVIELLRRRQLRERHAIWWLVAGLAALVAGFFPQSLGWAAQVIGIEVPINLIFFVSIAVLFLVCLQHSAELTKLEAKSRTLAELASLQGLRLQQLEDEVARLESLGTTARVRRSRGAKAVGS
jgi:hypothetical protein